MNSRKIFSRKIIFRNPTKEHEISSVSTSLVACKLYRNRIMPGRQSHGPLLASKPRNSKSNTNHRRKVRSLNALAIAEKQLPSSSGLSRARLNELDQRPLKRQRIAEEEHGKVNDEDSKLKRPRNRQDELVENDNIEVNSDSDGNEWKTGEVDSEEDSDIDSDEAMGESDEERFEGFVFRGSTGGHPRKRGRGATATGSTIAQSALEEFDLDEAENAEDEESDGLGDDAIDMAELLDQSSGLGEEGRDDDIEREDEVTGLHKTASDVESEQSISEEEDEADPEKLSSLQKLVLDLEGSTRGDASSRANSLAHESMPPSEFALPTKNKLTLDDLLPSIADPKLRRSLKTLSNTSTKPSSKRSGIPGKLDVPLPKRQQDRLDRAAAYGKAKETLNRWIDTVKHNRRAEHLSFPLRDPGQSVPQGKDKLLPTVNSKPVNSLESEIQNILEESGLAAESAQDNRDEEFAELEANRPTLEEVQARRANLRRARDLLFREEQRAKRIKKIKSKTYRKIHRKDRDRLALQSVENRAIDGVEDSEEEKRRNDRRRAEERMGARHRESRWAKGIKDSGRAMWDQDARQGVHEMARRGEDLKRRIQGKDVEREDDSATSSESDEGEDRASDHIQRLRESLTRGNVDDTTSNQSTHFKSSLHDMEFMRKADAAQKARNDEAIRDLKKTLIGESSSSEDEDDAAEGLGRRKYGPVTNPASLGAADPHPRLRRNRIEFEEGEASDEGQDEIRFEGFDDANAAEPAQGKSSHQALKKNPFSTGQISISHQHLGMTSTSARAFPETFQPAPDKPPSALTSAPESKVACDAAMVVRPSRTATVWPSASGFVSKSKISIAPSPPSLDFSNNSDADDDTPQTPSQALNSHKDILNRAFAGDDVEIAFKAEKQALVEEEGPQTTDTTLPGWGRWAGPSLSKKDKAFNSRHRFTTTTSGVVDAAKRKDRSMDKVIINERRQKKGVKYLASQLPHPFETKGQYERSLRLPMGPEWGTKESFQGMTKPRVMVKQGVIKAMERPVI